jgi:hypothetical protein
LADPQRRSHGILSAIAITCAGTAACSLFTDLGGVTGDDDASAPPADASAPDSQPSSGDGSTGTQADAADDTTLVDPDAGDGALPEGVLSKDDFDTSCATWGSYKATVELVTDAYAGAGACKICLTETGVSGGLTRDYPSVLPGKYSVSARVKNVNSGDWRFTIVRTVDGGAEPHYASGSFSSAGWQLAGTSARGEGPMKINIWFGTAFQAGDCALVDEVIVTREP